LVATDRHAQEVISAVQSFPEAEYMWSLTTSWGGFGGMVTKDWRERERSTAEMFEELFGQVSQTPGLRVFPRLDPPLPTPGQYDVEFVIQSTAPA
jgi:multidrug efflux pump